MSSEIVIEKNSITQWGTVGTLIWSTIIAFVFLLTQTIAIRVYIGFVYGKMEVNEYAGLMSDLQYNGYVLSLCTFTTLFICSGLILGIIKLKKGTRIKDYLGLYSVKPKTIFFWLSITIFCIILSDALASALGRPIVPEFVVRVYSSIDRVWVLWLAVLVAAPVFEEIFFRGFIFRGLSSSFIGPIGAIIISSVAWSAIHLQYDLYEIASIFVIGLVLGTARFVSGSVILTIGLHSFASLVATIETALTLSIK